MDEVLVSLVLSTHCPSLARYTHIRYSVRSLLESLDVPCELIVIDNSFEEGIRNYYGDSLSHLFFKGLSREYHIRYTGLKKNYGLSYARNLGIEKARGKFVALVDNDMRYKKGWLSECLKILDERKHERVIASAMDSLHRKREKYLLEDLGSYLRYSRCGAGNWVMRKPDCEVLGKWDEAAHKTDTKFINGPIKKHGFTFLLTKESMVFHEGHNMREYDIKKPYFTKPDEN